MKQLQKRSFCNQENHLEPNQTLNQPLFFGMQMFRTKNYVITWLQFKCDMKSILFMDFMLEEELIDLMTFCLQNPNSVEISNKHKRITEIGHELFVDGGVDALENFFFVLKNRITEEIEKDPSPMRSLWNGLTDKWQY